ncbi:MAG: CDP-alcohol phosphatidyltransferase family protein [Gemmatimonadota bacterium]
MSLQPILGRSPVQRHLQHLAAEGIPRCTILLEPGPEASEAGQECRRQVAELSLGGMRVEIRSVSERGAEPRAEESGGAEPSDARAGAGAAGRAVASVPGTEPGAPAARSEILLLPGEGVYDPRLYRRVVAAPAPVHVAHREEGEAAGTGSRLRPTGLAKREFRGWATLRRRGGAGLPTGSWETARKGPADATIVVQDLPTYVPELRRHLEPYALLVRGERERRQAERAILASAQKGVLDLPARVLHPVPENLLVRWLARSSVTPNQITLFTGIIAFLATYLLATRAFGWGLAVALLVNVLDGVDGKLARVKLQTSPFGDRLDHLLDVTFEFSWYVAVGWGLMGATGRRLPVELGVGLVAVMTASRAVSGIYKWLSGRQIHDHRRFDRAFRLVAGRRNIYVLILLAGLAGGVLDRALLLTFGWGAATLLVYSVRAGMAFAAHRRKR